MVSLNKISLGIFSDTNSNALSSKNLEKESLKKLNINDIIQVDFPDNQYYKVPTDKNQITIHHTVSNSNSVNGDIAWWRSTADRIATALIIGHDGKIYQCFSSKYWGHHLGVKAEFLKSLGFIDYNTRNVQLNKSAIGIELDAWGGLIKYRDAWYPAKWDENRKQNVANVDASPVKNVYEISKGFRGYYGFEKYSNEQIEALRELLVFFNEKYGIPLDYNETMWDISKDALGGKSGIWTHVSYRTDKSDCYPDPDLINMLKSLKQ